MQKISKKDKSKTPLPDVDPYQAARSTSGTEKALCPTCNVVMRDCEPYAKGGEYYHPHNGCVNSGKSMGLTDSKSGGWASLYKKLPGETNRAKKFLKKRDRRAKNRGARQARKLRP